MFFANSLLLLTSVIVLVLGMLIFISNPKKLVNQILALYVLSVLIWTGTNLLTNIAASPSLSLFFARATMVGAATIPFFFLIFTWIFTNEKMNGKRILTWSIIPLILLISTPTSLNITSIESHGNNTKTGAAYLLLVFELLFYFGIALVKLLRTYRRTNDVFQKTQIKYIFIGIVLTLIPGILANAVLPILGYSNAIFYGPSAVIFLTFFVTLAIVRHRLLDIRLVVARSLVYVFTVASVGLIYAVLVLVLGSLFFSIQNVSYSQRIFFAVLTLVIGVTYSSIVRFFNKYTNKFFYRDAYETQTVLDQLGAVIVGNVSTHKIQHGALVALESALKPVFMSFLLLDSQGKIQPKGSDWQAEDAQALQKALKELGNKLTIYDEIEEKHAAVKAVLREEGVSIVAPLVTKEGVVGYLVAGPKRSGNIYTGQDVGLVSIAANELAVALQNAQRFEEIQAFNITLQEKVTEATRELKSTNKKLIALDEAKDEFISMASHQLRTPLTSIKGYLSMIVEGDMGKVTVSQEKALKEAFASSQRMVFLIADFLNVSRIKTGKFLIEKKPIDLPVMVHEEITQLREMAGSKNLTLEYDEPHNFPTVMLDDNKMRQVMMNIVDNAIYYTPEDGKIIIQLYATENEIIFKVIDNGIGVPKAEQHKLFTKFYRAGNARKARPDGTGLGLYMAQKIVVEQNGSIIFESVEGKGSTFGFRFPLSKVRVS